MSPAEFRAQIAQLTAQLAGRPLDADLDAWLNAEHGVESDTYRQLTQACMAGVAEGWLCDREGGGIRYGRMNCTVFRSMWWTWQTLPARIIPTRMARLT